MSSIYKVCFAPNFTEEFKLYIKAEVNPSMIERDNFEGAKQYPIVDIEAVLSVSKLEGFQISVKDEKELNSLIEQKVQYVEF